MKINLTGLGRGIIGLENRVIDLYKPEVRPRVSKTDLAILYDECVERIGEFNEFFEDQEALEKTRSEVAGEKRAQLVARDSVYPSFFNFKYWTTSPFEHIFNPDKPIEEPKYFHVARYMTQIPLGNGSPFGKLVDTSSKRIVKVTPKEYKSGRFVPRIEIPNDRTQEETKASTYHETLHHLVTNYQVNSGRLFTPDHIDATKRDRHIAENWIHENVVEYLTDLMLEDDKDALFEQRWSRYEMANSGVRMLLSAPSAIATGLILGSSLGNPQLLPLAFIPGIAKNFIYRRYKTSKKDMLTQPRERAEFKI